MKKLILNEPIRNNAGEVIVSETGRVLPPAVSGRDPQREVKPITFAGIINQVIESIPNPGTDEDVRRLDNLSKAMIEVLAAQAPSEVEVGDADFEVIKSIIDKQRQVVRARFLEMVDKLN